MGDQGKTQPVGFLVRRNAGAPTGPAGKILGSLALHQCLMAARPAAFPGHKKLPSIGGPYRPRPVRLQTAHRGPAGRRQNFSALLKQSAIAPSASGPAHVSHPPPMFSAPHSGGPNKPAAKAPAACPAAGPPNLGNRWRRIRLRSTVSNRPAQKPTKLLQKGLDHYESR